MSKNFAQHAEREKFFNAHATGWEARNYTPEKLRQVDQLVQGLPLAHGCIGCSEQNFWDQGSFYDRITTIPHLGTNATAETVGVAAVAGVAAGVAVHGVASMVRHAGSKNTKNSSDTDSNN